MQAAMVCVAVEGLIRHEALGAGQVHSAVRAPHHVFAPLCLGLVRAPVCSSSVGFQDQVSEEETGDDEKDFSQAAFRRTSCR
jgi:hypothetical protein